VKLSSWIVTLSINLLANSFVCGVYDENAIRERVGKINVYQSYLTAKNKNDDELIIQF